MVLLSLDSPRHIYISSILTEIGISDKLLVESLGTHVLFDSVNNLDDVLDVLLELFTNLQAVH